MTLAIILFAILMILVFRPVPGRPFTRGHWRFSPNGGVSGGLAVIFVIVGVLLFMARV